MQIQIVLTRGFFENRCKPLIELGISTWQEAFNLGLINQTELNFCQKQAGIFVPTLEDFNSIQSNQLANLRQIAI